MRLVSYSPICPFLLQQGLPSVYLFSESLPTVNHQERQLRVSVLKPPDVRAGFRSGDEVQ